MFIEVHRTQIIFSLIFSNWNHSLWNSRSKFWGHSHIGDMARVIKTQMRRAGRSSGAEQGWGWRENRNYSVSCWGLSQDLKILRHKFTIWMISQTPELQDKLCRVFKIFRLSVKINQMKKLVLLKYCVVFTPRSNVMCQLFLSQSKIKQKMLCSNVLYCLINFTVF